METERERPQDEDVPFQLPERHPAELKSGFKRAATKLGTRGAEGDPRRSPRDRKDVPKTPLAERGRRGR